MSAAVHVSLDSSPLAADVLQVPHPLGKNGSSFRPLERSRSFVQVTSDQGRRGIPQLAIFQPVPSRFRAVELETTVAADEISQANLNISLLQFRHNSDLSHIGLTIT